MFQGFSWVICWNPHSHIDYIQIQKQSYMVDGLTDSYQTQVVYKQLNDDINLLKQ